LAGTRIYLAGLAQVTGVDLSVEAERKLAENPPADARPTRTAC
jgi:hypothetical protein